MDNGKGIPGAAQEINRQIALDSYPNYSYISTKQQQECNYDTKQFVQSND